MTQYLTIWDLILTPIYLLVLSAIAKKMRDKRYPVGHPLRKYFMPGLYVKFGGAIFIALIYAYYYKGGDTFNFFYHTKVINSSLDDSFSTWFKLITRADVVKNPEIYNYAAKMEWYSDPSSYTVAVIAAILGLFTATSYLPTALLFAFLSFTGVWAMYKTFVNIYPRLPKELAIAFLFIPSTFVWGSAIFKDTLCLFGLGWLCYAAFRIFLNRDYSIKNIFLLLFSFYLLSIIKLYILISFLPALGLWILLTYSSKIKSTGARWMINIAFILFITGSFFFLAEKFSEELNKYSLDRIAQTAATTRDWLSYVTEYDQGSGYDLGEFEPTLEGMLSKFPQAVVVTLFRPFIWEVRKVIVALSAIEAVIFLYFFIRVLFKKGFKFFGSIAKDPTLTFFIVFTLIFAFSVGISTYNFGALSRYKIPCLPFFAALLVVLLQSSQSGVAKKITVKRQNLQKAPTSI
ncbi:MAG: hypothetical protein ACR2GN_02395 [Bacteroidia bacterium]